MNCEHCRQLISVAVDQELTEGERGSLDEHLAQCSECAQYAEQIRELERLTAEWEASVMPFDVEQAVLSRARAKPHGWLPRLWSGSYRIPRPVAWAAAVLLLVLTVDAVRGPSIPEQTGPVNSGPALIRPAVQKIVLTESDVVSTYTTQAVSKDL